MVETFREQMWGYMVNYVARAFSRALHKEINGYGVMPGQFPVLLALYQHKSMSQQELCELVRIEQPTMANTLKRMERDGLIERTPAADDRRRSVIRLTPRAWELQENLYACARGINERASAGMSTEDKAQGMRLLRRLVYNLEGGFEDNRGS